VSYCKDNNPDLWSYCEQQRDQVTKGLIRKGFVSVENLNEYFIVPQTKGLSSGIALNMNNNPLQYKAKQHTQVLLSHAWREDILQVIDLLDQAVGNVTLHDGRTRFSDNTVVWFSAFSLYQPEDSPTPKDQLAINPFREIVNNVNDMFVIQTSICDPYSKIWCVSELTEALERSKEDKLKIHPLFTKDWFKKFVKVEDLVISYEWVWNCDHFVYTTKRTPKEEEEEEEETNEIKKFVLKTAQNARDHFAEQLNERVLGTTYSLMEEDEKVEEENEDEEEPKLRYNVRQGLTNFDVYRSARSADKAEVERIDKMGVDKHGNKYHYWSEMQNIIVQFQKEAVEQWIEKEADEDEFVSSMTI